MLMLSFQEEQITQVEANNGVICVCTGSIKIGLQLENIR